MIKVILGLMIALSFTACAIGPEPEPERDIVSQSASTNPLHWMVGVWDCEVGYRTEPLANSVSHTTKGVYTAVEDSPTGLVTGQFREDLGEFPSMDYDDTWFITDEPVPGVKPWFRASYVAHGTKTPFGIQSTGGVRGPSETSNLLGFSSFGSPDAINGVGVITLPDASGSQATRRWSGADSSSLFNGQITRGRNWRVEVNVFGTLHTYITEQCSRRSQVAISATSSRSVPK